jgi:hypothetical protein
MGITQWLPRKNTILMSEQPLFCATCLVLLPQKLLPSDMEQHKILTGMLKVLELNSKELAIAWIEESLTFSSASYNSLIEALSQWAPYTVLGMGKELVNKLFFTTELDETREKLQKLTGLDSIVQTTYHPAELQALPENKKKAYRDLLTLKDYLSVVKET